MSLKKDPLTTACLLDDLIEEMLTLADLCDVEISASKSANGEPANRPTVQLSKFGDSNSAVLRCLMSHGIAFLVIAWQIWAVRWPFYMAFCDTFRHVSNGQTLGTEFFFCWTNVIIWSNSNNSRTAIKRDRRGLGMQRPQKNEYNNSLHLQFANMFKKGKDRCYSTIGDTRREAMHAMHAFLCQHMFSAKAIVFLCKQCFTLVRNKYVQWTSYLFI